MKWNDVFVAPFKLSSTYIFDSRSKICLNTFVNSRDSQKIIDKLNGDVDNKPKSGKFTISKDKQRVLFNNSDVLLVRAWGRLTGGGGLNLPAEEAEKLQDAFIEWIVETLNS